MDDLYADCRLCPRDCGVDRTAGSGGYCGESAALQLAFAGLHRGEEPPLSGSGGSGTIFVSGCNLGCAFCQNRQISSGKNGKKLGRVVAADEFSAICCALQQKGAENINIVTGSHAVPALVQGLRAAKNAGLHIPVLWNSSAYESPLALELLDSHVDGYLPDLKTLDAKLAAKFCNAPDYPAAASQAIKWMLEHKPGGVIIRHLILPGYLESTRAVLRWFAENARGKAQLSLMSQYTPIITAGEPHPVEYPERFVNKQEYETVIGWLEEFGIEDGFCQELVCGSDWLPDFSQGNPFSSDLSVAVWHFTQLRSLPNT